LGDDFPALANKLLDAIAKQDADGHAEGAYHVAKLSDEAVSRR